MGSYKGLSPHPGSEATLTAINCGRVMAPATRGITLAAWGVVGRAVTVTEAMGMAERFPEEFRKFFSGRVR